MTRISPIDHEVTSGRTRELLDSVKAALGATPNMMKTMAQSTAVLEGYLAFNSALSNGVLRAPVREQIALAVAEANACDYCLSAHAALGKAAGLQPEEVASARRADSRDRKTDAILKFAQEVVRQRGHVPDQAVPQARAAGLSDGEIAEVIAHVALNVLTNYFNSVAQTEIDFPRVSAARQG
jgi:uncharacterized peroxidase-related enzyme